MKRTHEVLVGLLLTAGLIIGVIGTIWLSRGGLAQGYPLYSRFQWGAGLKQGQQVQLGGVAIGYVDDLELDMVGGTVLVTMRIQPRYKVPQTTTAYVQAYGLFGDQIIAMKPSSPSSTVFESGDTVPAGPPQPTTAEIIARVDSIGENLGDVAEAFEIQLVQSGGIEDLRRSLAGMNQLVLLLNSVAAEQSRQLTLTQQGLRSTLAAFDSADVDSAVKNLKTTSANLATLTADFQKTSTQLQVVLAKVDSGTGSAAMLLNDPGLYNDLRRAATRLDSLILDVKTNPRKYIKVSVF